MFIHTYLSMSSPVYIQYWPLFIANCVPVDAHDDDTCILVHAQHCCRLLPVCTSADSFVRAPVVWSPGVTTQFSSHLKVIVRHPGYQTPDRAQGMGREQAPSVSRPRRCPYTCTLVEEHHSCRLLPAFTRADMTHPVCALGHRIPGAQTQFSVHLKAIVRHPGHKAPASAHGMGLEYAAPPCRSDVGARRVVSSQFFAFSAFFGCHLESGGNTGKWGLLEFIQ